MMPLLLNDPTLLDHPALMCDDQSLCLRADILQSGVRLGLRQWAPSVQARWRRARSRRTCRMPGRVFGCPHCLFGPNFPDLAALNLWLEQRCMEVWREIPHGGLPGRRCLHRREGV